MPQSQRYSTKNTYWPSTMALLISSQILLLTIFLGFFCQYEFWATSISALQHCSFLFPFPLKSVPRYSLNDSAQNSLCWYIKCVINFYLCLCYKGYFVFALFKKVSFKNSTSEDKVFKGPPFAFNSRAPKMMSEGQKKKN